MNTPVAAKMMTIPFALARDFLSRGASKLPTVNAGAHAGTAIGLDHPQAALCTSACVIGACALFLLVDLSYPLVLWDESRLAVNAIEMYQSGASLVSTYGFQPDLWNTKPPLLIWLMVGSMRLFGPSEWALRLPSAVAAIATLAIVTGFTWRLTRPTSTALLACIFLVTSRDFFGNHAAATGDYDALLCLFTTAYVCVLFFALHRRRPNPWAILSAGALVAAAVLTKGIAGLFPGLGIVIYLVATRRWFRLFTSPWYLVSGCAAALVTAGYYGLRELAAPGFLAAVMHNELGDRYFRTIGAHIGSPWTYLLLICKGHFSVGPLALLAPFGLAARPSRSWLGLLYSLCIAGSLLILLSLGATKLEWYILPAYPFLARRRAEAAGALADSSAPMTRPELRCWCSC